ncbi:hypothetical protein C4K68_07705 [Pokkaliibacter plantistimulans]|uniref:Uncharacterized protein n=1 Tax=Proteobacteria bacterium 228 TaxID=2083153 RepID=A0A2S5KTD4_9PROT|nr:hypothetical protein C4K68_07705 [Pokkaliibacter plantistimulans]
MSLHLILSHRPSFVSCWDTAAPRAVPDVSHCPTLLRTRVYARRAHAFFFIPFIGEERSRTSGTVGQHQKPQGIQPSDLVSHPEFARQRLNAAAALCPKPDFFAGIGRVFAYVRRWQQKALAAMRIGVFNVAIFEEVHP